MTQKGKEKVSSVLIKEGGNLVRDVVKDVAVSSIKRNLGIG